MNRFDRILTILVSLQSRVVLRAEDLARRFGVSTRTIYRDIRSLEQAGVPICGEAGWGYSLADGYRLPPLTFTPEEALAFQIAQKCMSSLTDTQNYVHFASAMDKVRAVMRSTQRDYALGLSDKIAVRQRMPQSKIPNLLQAILRSIDEKEILTMGYTNTVGRVAEREIEAVGMIFSNPYWYLKAWCHLRGEYRTFRLDRIDHLATTGRRHTIDEHPDLINLNEVKTMKINSIEVKKLESIEVIALEYKGDYSGIGCAFNRVVDWATKNNYWALGPCMLGVYHDDPQTTPAEKLRSSAALEAKSGMQPGEGMIRDVVQGGMYLVMNATVTMPEYGEAWRRVMDELAARGLEDDNRDHYERYIGCTDTTQGEDAPWIVEFCIPVK